MSIFDLIKGWFSDSESPDYTKVVYMDSLSEVPKAPGKTIYIIKDGPKLKWVVFRCPDDCGRRVEVNLMQSRYPNWNLKVKKNKVSLYPSVVVNGCGAHFWLNDSKVNWARFVSPVQY